MTKSKLMLQHIEDIKKDFINSNWKIVESGTFENKEMLKLQLQLSLINFSEHRVIFYEDINNISLPTWIDIEGVGYGWLALDDDENKNKKTIKNYINMNLKNYVGLNYIVFKNNNELIWYFFDNKKDILYKHNGIKELNIEDYLIRISNNELHFMI